MALFTIHKDYSRSPKDGVTFQLAGVSIEREDGSEDVSDRVDVGMHFSDDDPDRLVRYFSETFEVAEAEVDIQAE